MANEEMMAPLVRQSAELDKLFTALSAAQGEMTDPAKDKVAVIKSSKGEYGYKYSDLSDLLKIIRPVFSKHGLALLQLPVSTQRGGVTIVTRVCHAASGQWIESDLTMALGDDRPQTLGSAITYGKRYTAGGVAGVSPGEDDDGHAAQHPEGPGGRDDRRQQMKDDRHRQAGQDRASSAQGAAQQQLTQDQRSPPKPKDTAAIAEEQRLKFVNLCIKAGIKDSDDQKSLMADFKDAGLTLAKLPAWLEARKAEAALVKGTL